MDRFRTAKGNFSWPQSSEALNWVGPERTLGCLLVFDVMLRVCSRALGCLRLVCGFWGGVQGGPSVQVLGFELPYEQIDRPTAAGILRATGEIAPQEEIDLLLDILVPRGGQPQRGAC